MTSHTSTHRAVARLLKSKQEVETLRRVPTTPRRDPTLSLKILQSFYNVSNLFDWFFLFFIFYFSAETRQRKAEIYCCRLL